MALGIRKITENVVDDGRSLVMIKNKFKDNDAVPDGALIVNTFNRSVEMKTAKGVSQRLNGEKSIADLSITTNLLQINSVTNSKIANNAVTEDKIQNDSISTYKIKDKAITELKIADESINTTKLQTDSVTTNKIIDYAIIESKLAPLSISTSKIQNKAILAEKIEDKQILSNHLNDASVTEDKIANNAITELKIAEGAISNNKIQNNTITYDKFSDNAKAMIQSEIEKEVNKQIESVKNELESKLDRLIMHDGNGNINGANNSTVIKNLSITGDFECANNIKCSGDIQGQRVYFMTYKDLAEGYIPGEELNTGDIVAMGVDGKIYKAKSMNDCIVGVVSEEFANCFGATKEELATNEKIAVGMIGQIHVNVKGPVRLGQRITISASDPGVGVANWINGMNIGKALETIECNDYSQINKVLVQVKPV